MSCGYSSGWNEECWKKPLVTVEILCQAKGDKTCRFVMGEASYFLFLVIIIN